MIHMKRFLETSGLKDEQVVGILNRRYMGFGDTELDMLCCPADFGMRLLDSAETYLKNSVGIKTDMQKRKLSERVYFRATPELKYDLQRAVENSEYDTMQDALTDMVKAFIERSAANV